MQSFVDESFPPYSYVPGMFPHPVSHPDGHRYEVAAGDAIETDPMRWRECRAYLRGLDLFNRGYYWEAHECWETIWHNAGRRGPIADFLKALIKLAAAMVKGREGRVQGVERHARRAVALLNSTLDRVGSESFMGLSPRGLIELAETIAANPDRFLDIRRAPVIRIRELELVPAFESGQQRDA